MGPQPTSRSAHLLMALAHSLHTHTVHACTAHAAARKTGTSLQMQQAQVVKTDARTSISEAACMLRQENLHMRLATLCGGMRPTPVACTPEGRSHSQKEHAGRHPRSAACGRVPAQAAVAPPTSPVHHKVRRHVGMRVSCELRTCNCCTHITWTPVCRWVHVQVPCERHMRSCARANVCVCACMLWPVCVYSSLLCTLSAFGARAR